MCLSEYSTYLGYITLIIGCGEKSESTECPDWGITAWAPPEGTGQDFLNLHQTYGCPGKKRGPSGAAIANNEREIYQTTSFHENNKKMLVLEAQVIATYLLSDDVVIVTKKLKATIGKGGITRFTAKNLFDHNNENAAAAGKDHSEVPDVITAISESGLEIKGNITLR